MSQLELEGVIPPDRRHSRSVLGTFAQQHFLLRRLKRHRYPKSDVDEPYDLQGVSPFPEGSCLRVEGNFYPAPDRTAQDRAIVLQIDWR